MDITAQKQAIIEKLATVEDEFLLSAIQRMLDNQSPGNSLTPEQRRQGIREALQKAPQWDDEQAKSWGEVEAQRKNWRNPWS